MPMSSSAWVRIWTWGIRNMAGFSVFREADVDDVIVVSAIRSTDSDIAARLSGTMRAGRDDDISGTERRPWPVTAEAFWVFVGGRRAMTGFKLVVMVLRLRAGRTSCPPNQV